jgi:hypothetical protein
MINRVWQALKSRHQTSTTQLEVLRSQSDFKPIGPIPVLPKDRKTLLVAGFWIIVIIVGILGWKLVSGR